MQEMEVLGIPGILYWPSPSAIILCLFVAKEVFLLSSYLPSFLHTKLFWPLISQPWGPAHRAEVGEARRCWVSCWRAGALAVGDQVLSACFWPEASLWQFLRGSVSRGRGCGWAWRGTGEGGGIKKERPFCLFCSWSSDFLSRFPSITQIVAWSKPCTYFPPVWKIKDYFSEYYVNILLSKRLLVWIALPFPYLTQHRSRLPHDTFSAPASPPSFFSCFKIPAVLTIHISYSDIQLHNALSYWTTLCENLVPLGI